MKIKSLNILNDGLEESVAERIWEQTEANANYQFNKSHSVEYSIISMWGPRDFASIYCKNL